MREVVANPDPESKRKIDRLVTVEYASCMYLDFSALAENVHEGADDEYRVACIESAWSNRVNVESTFRGNVNH